MTIYTFIDALRELLTIFPAILITITVHQMAQVALTQKI